MDIGLDCVERVVVCCNIILHETFNILDGVHLRPLPIMRAVYEGIFQMTVLQFQIIKRNMERVNAQYTYRRGQLLGRQLKLDTCDAIDVKLVFQLYIKQFHLAISQIKTENEQEEENIPSHDFGNLEHVAKIIFFNTLIT